MTKEERDKRLSDALNFLAKLVKEKLDAIDKGLIK